MTIFVLSFVLFLLAILGMAAGVLAGRPAIKGSCGGLNRGEKTAGGCGLCDGGCADDATGRAPAGRI